MLGDEVPGCTLGEGLGCGVGRVVVCCPEGVLVLNLMGKGQKVSPYLIDDYGG